MTTTIVGREEEVKALIDNLDLDPIKVKLLDPEDGVGWNLQKVEDVEGRYRKFLFLSYKHPERAIVPSKDVDKFWHYHILDTRKYTDDCQRIFGYFLHHFPYFGMRGEEDARNLQEAFRETNEVFYQEFGERLSSVSSAWCSGECSSQDCGTCGPRTLGEGVSVRPRFDRAAYV